MSSISVPVAGQAVSVSSFGAPVVNALNAITDGTNISTSGSATIGGNLTVSGIGQDRTAYKTANETVNNSAVLQADDHLTLPVVANAVYRFEFRPEYISGTTPDIKIQFSGPSGATAVYGGQYADTAGAMAIGGNFSIASLLTICGSGGDLNAVFSGILTVSSTAGNFAVLWAQNTANLSNSTMYAGSYLTLRRIL